jgi:hypothetical protein
MMGAYFTRDFERQMEGSGDRMSPSKEPGRRGRGHLPHTLRDSKTALCKHSICLYGSSVRGTWKEGSYTEDYKRNVMEGSRNRAFLS